MTASSPPPTDEQRDQLVALARAFIVAEVGEDMGDGMTEQADRFADALLPAVSALLTEARADELRKFATSLDAAADRSDEWPDAAEAYRWSAETARYYADQPAARAAVRRTEGN